MKRIIIPVFFLVVLGIASLAYFSGNKPDILTTNVDPENKTIAGNDDSYTGDSFSSGDLLAFAQNFSDFISESIKDDSTMLAAAVDPSVKFVKVTPGMRKEEIAELVGDKLAWSDTQKEQFMSINKTVGTDSAEGYYYPDAYLLPAKADGYEVGKMMIGKFNQEVMSRYASSTKKVVNVETALKIASIIEREAAGKSDMRLISGIMWNRLFKNMTLDIDATLQYAKGNEDTGWWPKVKPEDKLIESPYNTYQNKGLTPTPISNPQLAAIEAALNPKKTSCMFYMHDKYRRIHCSATYKEHVKNIARYYKR